MIKNWILKYLGIDPYIEEELLLQKGECESLLDRSKKVARDNIDAVDGAIMAPLVRDIQNHMHQQNKLNLALAQELAELSSRFQKVERRILLEEARNKDE